MIFAIDPGPEKSAWVRYDVDQRRLVEFGKVDNEKMLSLLLNGDPDHVVIEMIASYGMPVGREVFETCVWIGRFIQTAHGDYDLLYRVAIKHHLCGSTRAKDGNVRQALIDAFGGKEKAIGKKSAPGPLYGVSGDVWSALAVAITFADRLDQIEAAA